MNLKRRIPQYIIGLLVFSFGVVTISQADVGISPVSTIPFALSKLTTLSFGTWTWIFHFFCVACQIVMLKKLTLKTILQFPLAFVFGKFIDQYKWLYEHVIYTAKINTLFLQYRYLICIAGILISAIGIVIVVSADLMLAPPDAFMRAFAARFKKTLSKVKIGFDVTWVVICIIICVIFFLVGGKSGFIPLLQSIFALTVVQGFTGTVGVGTLLSAWLNGTFVGIFGKWFPKLKMEPLNDLVLIPFNKKEA